MLLFPNVLKFVY